MVFVAGGSVEMVKLLLDNIQQDKLCDAILMADNSGKFFLYAAALAGHQDIVKTLMANKIVEPDYQYPCALHRVKSPDVLAILIQARMDETALRDRHTPLTAALQQGYIEVLFAVHLYHQELRNPWSICQPGLQAAPLMSYTFALQCL